MRVAFALIILTSFVGCTKSAPKETSQGGAAPASPEVLVERGAEVYKKNCIACHNPDPSKDGGLGPAVAGSSLALLEARILKASYPEGYKPKRETRTMPQMLHLKDDVEALAAYLSNR